jgi:splicing factor 45
MRLGLIATLRFQPTKRPQLAQKPKPKTQFPKAVPQEIGSSPASISKPPQTVKPAAKSTLADWTATGDDDDVTGFYAGEKRQRGGRKRRKNKHREEHVAIQDWDDIYDPARPNSYDEYKHSDEKIREIREWKDRLYAHRMARKSQSEKDSDEEDYRPQMNSKICSDSAFIFLLTCHRSICAAPKLLFRPSAYRPAITKSRYYPTTAASRDPSTTTRTP